jgi:hypothetical protein
MHIISALMTGVPPLMCAFFLFNTDLGSLTENLDLELEALQLQVRVVTTHMIQLLVTVNLPDAHRALTGTRS